MTTILTSPASRRRTSLGRQPEAQRDRLGNYPEVCQRNFPWDLAVDTGRKRFLCFVSGPFEIACTAYPLITELKEGGPPCPSHDDRMREPVSQLHMHIDSDELGSALKILGGCGLIQQQDEPSRIDLSWQAVPRPTEILSGSTM